MRASTTYHMQAIVHLPNGNTVLDADHEGLDDVKKRETIVGAVEFDRLNGGSGLCHMLRGLC